MQLYVAGILILRWRPQKSHFKPFTLAWGELSVITKTSKDKHSLYDLLSQGCYNAANRKSGPFYSAGRCLSDTMEEGPSKTLKRSHHCYHHETNLIQTSFLHTPSPHYYIFYYHFHCVCILYAWKLSRNELGYFERIVAPYILFIFIIYFY